MVVIESGNLKQLHLRPVRIQYVTPRAKTMFNGPWITFVEEQDSLLRFYHPAATDKYRPADKYRPVLANSLDVQRVELLPGNYLRVKGIFTFDNSKQASYVISLTPYSDEEVAEAFLFRTQIAYLIEEIKSFWEKVDG